jgi:hypothetical protein
MKNQNINFNHYVLFFRLDGKPKIGRKSVSFQNLNDETEVPKGKGEVNQSESNNSNKK